MLFLFVFYIPNIGFVWVNYLLVASTVLAIPAILLTQERLVVNYLLVASTVLAIPAILLTQER